MAKKKAARPVAAKANTVTLSTKDKRTMRNLVGLADEVAKAGGMPFWYYNDEHVERRWIMGASEQQVKDFGKMHLRKMKDMTCYISVRGADNSYTLADDDVTQYREIPGCGYMHCIRSTVRA